MKVSLGIPFRSNNDPSRIYAYGKTLEFLLDSYQWHQIATFDTSHPRFNRAAARNKAVRRFQDSDVIVLCDADSIPESAPLERAIKEAAVDGLIHYPFDTVHDITKNSTRLVGQRPLHCLKTIQTYGPSEGGCFVFNPNTWWQAGGMDERLTGWGFEDRVFLITNHTLVGKPKIHTGNLYCLWHDRGKSVTIDPGDSQLFNEYSELEGKPEELREYLYRRGSNKDG